MKVLGWVLIIWGAVAFVAGLAAAANGYPARTIGGGIGFVALGGYLIHRANQKKEEEENPDNWSNE